jgi:hypothetical protein
MYYGLLAGDPLSFRLSIGGVAGSSLWRLAESGAERKSWGVDVRAPASTAGHCRDHPACLPVHP